MTSANAEQAIILAMTVVDENVHEVRQPLRWAGGEMASSKSYRYDTQVTHCGESMWGCN